MLRLAGGLLAVFVVGGVLLVGFLVATGQPSDQGADVPDVNWTIQRVNDTHVRVAHDGGSAVDAANLSVTVDGNERQTGWSGRVAVGTATTVQARADAVVRVVYGIGDDRVELTRRAV